MATIKAKHTATILAKSFTNYDPATFSELAYENFKEVSADEVLATIHPFKVECMPGKSFIAIDTETFYTGVASNRLPKQVVRRWIKHGSKFIPNDFPFCISISDGISSYAVYDTLENRFAEFRKLMPLLMDTNVCKIGHNIGFDMHMLANARVDMRGELHDTYHLSKLVRADAFTHNLLDIAEEIQSDELPTVGVFERMLDSYKAQYRITDYRLFPRDLMTQYTCADTWNTVWVFKELLPKIFEWEITELYSIEQQMLRVAYSMEREGIRVDLDYENVIIPELIKEMEDAERKVYETAGTIFNLNSSQQLEAVMRKLGYGHMVKYNEPTKSMLEKGITKGNPSFDKYEMERLENEGVPLIADIQQYKAAEKLLNTFAKKLYEMRDFDGYVHCNFNTIEAKTGRFSISSPSMQNMPRRKDSRIRAAFIAPEDYELYDFDFKAQESIILVHYSRCEYLLQMLREGKDIHTAVATLIYSVPYEAVTKELREVSKSVEFAIVYGAGPQKVATMTKLPFEEAVRVMKLFLKNAPEVDNFIRSANAVAKRRRMIKTILGRRVYVNHGQEYACVNYVCQGGGADSTKTKMVLIYKFLKANGFKTKMSLQVHDSLLQTVYKEELDKHILEYLKWLQTERDLFRVPVKIDVSKCSPTWRDKVELDIKELKPPDEMLTKAENYNIWEEGLL